MANKKTTIIAYRGLIELNFYEYSPRARYKRWFLYISQATGKPEIRNPTLVSGANIAAQAQQRLTWKGWSYYVLQTPTTAFRPCAPRYL